MDMRARAEAELSRLRRDIARIEGRLTEADRLVLDVLAPGREADALSPGAESFGGPGPRERHGRLPVGVPALDALIGGGLPLAALSDIRTGETRDGAAAAGFVLALVARLTTAGGVPSVLWISEAETRREIGALYAPGLSALGVDPARVAEVAAHSQAEALWAFEAAMACRGLGVAVCALRRVSLDLTATRRCALRAQESGVTGFLLRLGSAPEPSAAELRFGVSPAPAGTIGGFAAGVGRPAWRVALERNRGGRLGTFILEWNAYERSFAERADGRLAYLEPFATAPSHRPPHPGGVGLLKRAS
jgi:protein ImuA